MAGLTRSRIEAFDQTANVLTGAATRWRNRADVLERAAGAYVEQISTPNGTAWQGQTAESAFAMAHADRLTVYGGAEQARGMADTAERGGETLRGARASALEAIAQAEDEDFSVGEDLSVSDRYAWASAADRAARQGAAVAHRDYIAHAASRLGAENERVAAALNAGAAKMAGMAPAHWRQPRTVERPAGAGTESRRKGTIRAVDNTVKRDGGPDPQPPPDDAPAEAARRYDQTRRAADQALVDKAKAEGRDAYAPGMEGQPGYMTIEEADAAARLRDYNTLTDPDSHIARHGGPDARQLAGERLDDYTVSRFAGPLPADTVLGGDARTRAQARLELQHNLENGNTSWHQQVMTPDAATRLIDQMEVQDRALALDKLHDGLVAGGMSPGAAARIVDGFAHGTIPDEYVDAAAAAGKAFDAGNGGLEHFAESLPTGSHWAPGVAYSAEDIASLKRLAGRVGYVGNALEFGTGLYEWQHGAPLGEIAMKAGGGVAGAWIFGEGGAWLGGAIAGPPGAFIGALIFGAAGGIVGDNVGKDAFTWLTE